MCVVICGNFCRQHTVLKTDLLQMSPPLLPAQNQIYECRPCPREHTSRTGGLTC